jgi:hypothetical protein
MDAKVEVCLRLFSASSNAEAPVRLAKRRRVALRSRTEICLSDAGAGIALKRTLTGAEVIPCPEPGERYVQPCCSQP